MIRRVILLIGFVIALSACETRKSKSSAAETYSDVIPVSAMRQVMWKGELDARISLDTLSDRKGLYGLGPESYLKGEILINNGKSFISRVLTDSTMAVIETYDTSAPFFVYAYVKEWDTLILPKTVHNIKDLESYLQDQTQDIKRPFVFKLQGEVIKATIHIQNLPEGTMVSSPEDAHRGQTNYGLADESATIIGFFSTVHQGVFTHHDSYLHMHLITEDEKSMGHLDEVEIGQMKLFLPRK